MTPATEPTLGQLYVSLPRVHCTWCGGEAAEGSTCPRSITCPTCMRGVHLHAFGVKSTGLRHFALPLVSADSLAWSLDARHSSPLPGHRHRSCANCLTYALAWRDRLIRRLDHGSCDWRWQQPLITPEE